MVVVVGRRRVTRSFRLDWGNVVSVVVIMLIIVVSKMTCMTLCVLDRIANADHRCVGGVQGEQQCKKNGEGNAHRRAFYRVPNGQWASVIMKPDRHTAFSMSIKVNHAGLSRHF